MSKSGIFIVALLILGGGAFIWQQTAPAVPAGHVMTPPDLSNVGEGKPIADVTVPAKFSANAKIVLDVIFNITNGRKYANNLKLTFL